MRSAPGKPGLDLLHAEKISSVAAVGREACEPFLRLSSKLAHADDGSIIPDLPTEDIIL